MLEFFGRKNGYKLLFKTKLLLERAAPYVLPTMVMLLVLAVGASASDKGQISAGSSNSSGAGDWSGGLPTLDRVLSFLRGPLAKVIALGGVVVGGMGLAFGESSGLRTAMLIVLGIGFIMAGATIVDAIFSLDIGII